MRIEASASTYDNAQVRCEAEGADLASVPDEAMQRALEVIIKEKKDSYIASDIDFCCYDFGITLTV